MDEWLSRSSNEAALDALEKAVSNLLKVGEVFCAALETKLECVNKHSTTAFHAPPSGECAECGGWLLLKSAPHEVPRDDLDEEARRLGESFHGTKSQLRRAAADVVKSRERGSLDGRRIVDKVKEPGVRIDGKVIRPRGKKGPRIL